MTYYKFLNNLKGLELLARNYILYNPELNDNVLSGIKEHILTDIHQLPPKALRNKKERELTKRYYKVWLTFRFDKLELKEKIKA